MTRATTIACGLTFLVILCVAAFLCSQVGAATGETPPPVEDDPISLALLGSGG